LKASIELAKVARVLSDRVKSSKEAQGGLFIEPARASFDMLFVTRRYEMQTMDYRWSFSAIVTLKETLDARSMQVLEELRKMECWATLQGGLKSIFRKRYTFCESPLLKRRGINFVSNLSDYLNGSEEVMAKLQRAALHELYVSAIGQPASKLPGLMASMFIEESKPEALSLLLYGGKGSELEITFKRSVLNIFEAFEAISSRLREFVTSNYAMT